MVDQAADVDEVFLGGRAFFQSNAPPLGDEFLCCHCSIQPGPSILKRNSCHILLPPPGRRNHLSVLRQQLMTFFTLTAYQLPC